MRSHTVEQLRSLRLQGMAHALEHHLESLSSTSLNADELVAKLATSEQEYRDQRRFERLIRQAKLKDSSACLENVDYVSNRGLDKNIVASLAGGSWIEKQQHLIITGPTGVGKTWLACAFAQRAIRKGIPVIFKRFGRVLEEMEIARGDGSLPKLRLQLLKPPLLILDDLGISAISVKDRQHFLELVEDRTGAGSILITSQLPVAQWHDYLNEPTIADAILDRLVHRSHRIELKGESMRKLCSGIGRHVK